MASSRGPSTNEAKKTRFNISKVSVMNKQEILTYLDNKFQKKEAADFNVGDTVRVHVRIKEGDSTRIQVFEGTVICFKGVGGARTFTVRKITFAIGVERTVNVRAPPT